MEIILLISSKAIISSPFDSATLFFAFLTPQIKDQSQAKNERTLRSRSIIIIITREKKSIQKHSFPLPFSASE